MPANDAFVRMYRDLVRRINALPQVRLSRVDPEAPAEPAEGWALSVGRQRVALGAAPTPPPVVHIATSTPTVSAATGRQLGTLWIRRQGGTLAGAWVLTGAATWTPVTWTDATLAILSLAKLADGELSAGVRDSLRTQLAVPSPPADTGWQPLTTLTVGHTAGTGANAPQWRVRDGIVYWRGRVTRDAGTWPAGLTHIANVPVGAQPPALLYTSATARGGVPLVAAINQRIQISPGAAGSTAEVELGSIPPYPTD